MGQAMLTPLALLATPALIPPAELQAMVEAFAQAPATVDPRLILPACPTPALAWAGSGSVEVRCAAPAWRIFVPAGRGQAAAIPSAPTLAPLAIGTVTREPPSIRRGDRVMLEATGAGFTVAMETTAAGDARDGRVPLRTAAGRALTGVIAADGRVTLTGLKSANPGR